MAKLMSPRDLIQNDNLCQVNLCLITAICSSMNGIVFYLIANYSIITILKWKSFELKNLKKNKFSI